MTLDLGITRRQRYVSDKTAANVTSSTYAQGGTITSYTYSGTTYIAHIFTSSGIFTVTSDIYPLDFIAVAGGGGGGNSLGSQAGGGGGGGGIVASGLLTTINKVYPSSAYIAVTTSTQANVLGGWVADSVFSDFNGSGAFHFTWRAIQQTAGGARTAVIPEQGADHQQAPLQFYMEIGITGIGPVDVAVALIRDGYPKDGFANMPYLNLNGGAAVGWTGVVTALGTFVAGDTLQIAWDASNAAGVGTYWWAGKNNTWAAGPFNYSNYALTTSTYQANGLRMIFMSAAAGGGSVRGQFRAGNENIYPAPSNGNALGISATTITNYSGYYTTPLGSNYVSSGTTYGVIIGAGGGVNSSSPTAQQGAPGSNGGDTVIYNPINPSFYYSTYFSNSYITATNAAFAFGTGDFTIETWLYPTASYGKYNAAYNIHPIFNSRTFINPDAADRGFIVYLDWYNKVTIQTSGTTYINTVNTVTNGVWSHLAVSRTNNIFNVWINGVKDRNTFFTATNFTNNSIMIGYGSNNNDLTQPTFFTGYLSNYRMVKGLSVYNPGIQGLTAPLTSTQLANVKGTPSTAIAGTLTSLLMLTTSTGAGAFYDSSLGTTATLTNNNVVTASGLGPGTYSGSLSFNGTNQYLTSATSTAFTFGTSDFTVEYWVYYNATNVTFQHAVGNATSSVGYAFGINTNLLHMTTVGIGYATTVIIKIQQWLHIAWARSGTNINVYMNGSWVYTFNNMVDNITETGFAIGARPTPTFYTNGYLSNIRVVKGVALYTNQGNFTPPTTISSATQSTSTNFTINAITTQTVLLTFNTATIVDLSTLSNVLTQTSGTVSISTFAPFTTSTVSLRAFGGGGGGAPTYGNGQIGGSGGGAPGLGHGGAAIPGQGNRGGQGSQSLGSGGGGFAYPGGPAVNEGTWPIYTANGQTPAGYGGAGGYFNHSGAMVAYSGGGGGGSWSITAYGVGLGGVGGGGNGGYYNITSNALIAATAGTRNLGGGGGGSNVSVSNAAAGGSGIVIFRYPAFLGDAARSPTDLTDTNLKNTTLLLSSNRTPASLTAIYSSIPTANSFIVDYLIVGGGGGGGGSTSTVTGGGGGGAGGVVSAVGYIPPGSFNTMFYADTAYTNGLATYPTTVGGWVNAGTDFISNSIFGYNWQYDNRGNSAPAAKTTALSEQSSYYIEIYCGATVLGPYSNQTGNRSLQIGLLRNSQTITTGWTGINLFDGNIVVNDANQTSPLGAWVTGDILNIAFDPINNKQWFGKNGVWWNGITPGTSGSGWNISGTGYLTIGFSNQSSNSSSMQGVFRKSTANTYTAPSGFVPYTYGYSLSSSTWAITVGSGGAGGTSSGSPTSGSSGVNSSISFSNTNFIAYGGGGGGAAIISISTTTIGSLSFNSASLQNLTVGTTSDFAFLHNGAQDYTLECWFYTNSTAYQGIMGTASYTGNVGFTIETGSGGPGVGAIWAIWQKGVVSQNIALTTTGGLFSTNVWNHLAMTFNATTKIVYMFINGQRTSPTSADLTSWAFSSANSTNPLNIGYGTSGSAYFSGYITNVRITKSIVYTGIFPVPTSPLTATQYANPFGGSNTQAITAGTHLLLTVNSATSYITDSSTNNFSVSNTTGVTYNSSSPPLLVSIYPGGSGASGGGGSYNLGGGITVSGQGNVGAPTGAMVLAASQSLSFNGSSQYLTAPSNAVFAFGTGDFTVELWFYPTSIPAGFPALIGRWDSSLGRSWVLQFNATSLIWTTGAGLVSGGDNTLTASSLSIAAATWYHVAVTRTGTTQYIYLNGVQVGTNSSSVNMTGTSPLSIGVYGIPTSPLSYFPGYISNVRVVKGLAVYTGAFTVPTRVLTITQTANPYGGSNVQAIFTGTYTSLLLTSSSITDLSSYNSTVTNNGSVVTTSSYPPINLFTYPGGGGGGAGSAGLWTANSSVGGSGGAGTYTSVLSAAVATSAGIGQVVNSLAYFGVGGAGAGQGSNGSFQFYSGTNITVFDNNAFKFNTGDFTIETWYNVTQIQFTSGSTFVGFFQVGAALDLWPISVIGVNGSGLVYYGVQGGSTTYGGWVPDITLNKWNHLALVRRSNVLTIYVNGVGQQIAASDTTNYNFTTNLTIGTSALGNFYFNGYMSNFRVVKGTAVYTGNFTVPSPPLTNIANTQLLLLANNLTNRDVDSSSNNLSITNNGSGYSSLSPTNSNSNLFSNANTATNYTGGGGRGSLYSVGTGAYSYNPITAHDTAGGARSTILPESGSYYFETVFLSGIYSFFGLARDTSPGGYLNVPMLYAYNGTGYGGLTGGTTLTAPFSSGDIIRIAYNATTNKVWIGKNSTWYLDPASTGGTTIPGTGNLRFIFTVGSFPPAIATGKFKSSTNNTYAPPSGFTAINAPVADAAYNSLGWMSNVTDYSSFTTVFNPGGAGGSGVVVVRFPSAQPDATITPSSSAIYINTSGYKNYIFTATGTISFATSASYITQNYISGYTSGTPIINNRTISDSSYNNIVINTATTTLAQGTFSPYGSMWSTSFNGSTDYLAFASTGTIFAQNSFFGANKSFTIEAWLNPNGFQTSNTATVILGDALPIGSGLAWSVGLDAQLKPMMYWRDIINGNNFITATNSISTGTWNHVAWVSNAGTPTIYINGLNQIVTTSTISTLTNTTQTFGMVVGPYFNKFYNGSISNLKASTSVLYLPDSRGNGASAYFNGTNYLSIAGSLSSTLVSATWGPATIEAWVWPTSTVNQHIFSSAQQVYLGANLVPFNLSTFNGQPSDGGYYIGFGSYNGTAWNSLLTTTTPLNINTWQHIAAVVSGEATKTISLYLNGVLIGSKSIASSGGWNGGGNTNNISYIGARWDSPAYFTGYISNVRFSNTATIYTGNFTPPALDLTNVSGTQLLSLLTTNTTVKDNSANSYVVTQVGGTRNNPLVGGFAPFTSTTYTSFTPSLIPFNAPVNTVLLTCNTYRHIDISTSSIAINTGTITSTPRIQRYSPYSMGYAYNPLTISGSASFNGFSDFVYTTTATDITNFTGTATSLQFESDFTVECWIYTTSTAVVQTIFDTAGKEGNTLRPNAFSLNMSTSGQLYFNYNNATSASSNLPVYRFAWTHIAVTRYSGIMQIWQNGSLTLGVNTTTNYSTGQMLIGRNGPTATAYFSGFISDFRVINGQAIYTNTFNPPVASLKPIDSTTSTGLLLNFNNVAIADATMNHNVIVVNSATISSSVTKYNPRSIFFPGVSEYLTVVPNSTSSYALGTADFTVEMWAYILPQAGWVGVNNLQPTTNRALFDMRTQNTANAGFDIYLTNTGTINVSTLNTVYVVGTTFVSVNNWHHIALVKKSTSFNLYLNGIPEGLNTATYITNFINPTVRIGFGVQTGYFNGYIDDVRITRGVARYSYPGFLVPQKSLPVK